MHNSHRCGFEDGNTQKMCNIFMYDQHSSVDRKRWKFIRGLLYCFHRLIRLSRKYLIIWNNNFEPLSNFLPFLLFFSDWISNDSNRLCSMHDNNSQYSLYNLSTFPDSFQIYFALVSRLIVLNDYFCSR